MFALGFVLVLQGVVCAAVSESKDDAKVYIATDTEANMQQPQLVADLQDEENAGYAVSTNALTGNATLLTSRACPEYGYAYYNNGKSGSSQAPPRFGYSRRTGITTWEHCGRLCSGARGCTHWTWKHTSNWCFLNDHSHTDKDTRQAYWISGNWNCYTSSGTRN